MAGLLAGALTIVFMFIARFRIVAGLVSLALGVLAAPPAVGAQRVEKVHRIGLLSGGKPSPLIEAFRQGLRDLGYVEGQNILIEYRWAEGRLERLPELTGELVRLKPDVIVAAATPGARAAKEATTTIPIVMIGVGDPVGLGYVASLARPGGNVTGLSSLSVDLGPKRLELLRAALPGVSLVGLMWNPADPARALEVRETRAAAERLGLRLQAAEVRNPDEVERSFTAMTRKPPDALIVLQDPFTILHRQRIADLALKTRLPAVSTFREFAEAGGFMSYGASLADLWRRGATFVDKILNGARPADLPVEQPTKFELVVNLKTAKALGLTIPPSVLIRADQVIQ
nr:ABC transporter substrate-binding protein [Nitrospirota bacterium]